MKENIINNFYDYVVNTTIKQNKIIDFNILYGDGSRWENCKNECFVVYNCLVNIIIENKLLG